MDFFFVVSLYSIKSKVTCGGTEIRFLSSYHDSSFTVWGYNSNPLFFFSIKLCTVQHTGEEKCMANGNWSSMLCDLVVISFSVFFCASNLRLQQLPIRCLRWLYSDVGTYKRKKKQSKTKLPSGLPSKNIGLIESLICVLVWTWVGERNSVSRACREVLIPHLSLSLFFLSFLFIFFFPRWHRIG